MTRTAVLLTCLLSALSAPVWAYGPGLDFAGGDYAATFDCSSFPSGSSTRTVEFWVRVPGVPEDPERTQPPGTIIEFGGEIFTGSAFGFYTYRDGTRELRFSGLGDDRNVVAKLPDDEWHFVAATYAEPTLRVFVDGVKWSETQITDGSGQPLLDTQVGTCYLGGAPPETDGNPILFVRGWYSNVNLGRITVFRDLRTPDEIWADQSLSSCPKTGTGYDNLVADIAFDDQSGSSFQVTGTSITVNTGDAPWIQGVSSSIVDPLDRIDEGVWFVIQSKEDVAPEVQRPLTSPVQYAGRGDFGIPARRQALAAAADGTGTVTMEMIPTKGDYDRFLWTAVDSGGSKHLVNKVSGALSEAGSGSGLVIKDDISRATKWSLAVANLEDWGTNAYSVTASGKRLAWDSGSATTEPPLAGDVGQAWMFQPMQIVLGYRLPEPDTTFRTTSCMYTKELVTDVGMTVYATTATRNWAAMNAQLVMRNIIKAMTTPATAPKVTSAQPGTKMVIYGDHDRDEDALHNQQINQLDPAEILEVWGSMDPATNTSHVTESMMCHKGVSYRVPRDTDYREFEQVVHEFAHDVDHLTSGPPITSPRPNDPGAIDYHYRSEEDFWRGGQPSATLSDVELALEIGDNSEAEGSDCWSPPTPFVTDPQKPYTCMQGEWYPWEAQKRFNVIQSSGPYENRTVMTTVSATFFDGVFRETNTWLPPRWLRTWQSETFELPDGGELNAGDELSSYQGHTDDLVFKVANGDAVVMQAGGTSTRWQASTHLTTQGSIQKVRFLRGKLEFLGINDTLLWQVDTVGTTTPAPPLRLTVSQPDSSSPGSFLKVLDGNNGVVWQSSN